jgi:hypothetical protein
MAIAPVRPEPAGLARSLDRRPELVVMPVRTQGGGAVLASGGGAVSTYLAEPARIPYTEDIGRRDGPGTGLAGVE